MWWVSHNPNGAFTSADSQAVHDRLQTLATEGIANYFGTQRFGQHGNTLVDGLSLLKGTLPNDHWPENKTRTMRRLVLSAVQSGIFNLVVAQRVNDGTLRTPLPGEVVIRRQGTKPYVFPADGPTENVIPAGPMTFGAGTTQERHVQRVNKIAGADHLVLDLLLAEAAYAGVLDDRRSPARGLPRDQGLSAQCLAPRDAPLVR